MRCHARDSGHPVNTEDAMAHGHANNMLGDYWIIRLRG
jgi:hypothetical protein